MSRPKPVRGCGQSGRHSRSLSSSLIRPAHRWHSRSTITWSILSGSSVSLLNATSVTDARGHASVNFNYVQAGSSQIVATTDLVPDEDQQAIVTETATGLSHHQG